MIYDYEWVVLKFYYYYYFAGLIRNFIKYCNFILLKTKFLYEANSVLRGARLFLNAVKILFIYSEK